MSFLGLEWEPACLEFHRTQRTVATASSWQVRQPLYDRSVGRWRNYERHLAPLLRALSSADDSSDPSAVDDGDGTLQDEVIAALSAAAEQYRAGRSRPRGDPLSRGLGKGATHPETLHWLGVIAGIRGRHQDAVHLIGRSIVVSAVRPDAHFDLGYALQQLGRVAEAEAAFCNALTLRPDYPAALAALGSMAARRRSRRGGGRLLSQACRGGAGRCCRTLRPRQLPAAIGRYAGLFGQPATCGLAGSGIPIRVE